MVKQIIAEKIRVVIKTHAPSLRGEIASGKTAIRLKIKDKRNSKNIGLCPSSIDT